MDIDTPEGFLENPIVRDEVVSKIPAVSYFSQPTPTPGLNSSIFFTSLCLILFNCTTNFACAAATAAAASSSSSLPLFSQFQVSQSQLARVYIYIYISIPYILPLDQTF